MHNPASHYDQIYILLILAAKSNEWTFRFILDQFLTQYCPPHQHLMFAGLLHLLVTGRVNVPGIIVVDHPVNHVPNMPQQMLNQRAPNRKYNRRRSHNSLCLISMWYIYFVDAMEKLIPRAVEEPQKDMTKRSATPVSSMSFTPTSVMRKMTAEGGKSLPPPNPSGFVPVPMSGALLPTPPTTAPVMMNSNNPNLASLMSNMGRHPPIMQYRPPPPMGNLLRNSLKSCQIQVLQRMTINICRISTESRLPSRNDGSQYAWWSCHVASSFSKHNSKSAHV